jgi:hypothetical protein
MVFNSEDLSTSDSSSDKNVIVVNNENNYDYKVETNICKCINSSQSDNLSTAKKYKLGDSKPKVNMVSIFLFRQSQFNIDIPSAPHLTPLAAKSR